jgi:FMN phosphatase YigB (HAD superfamily)
VIRAFLFDMGNVLLRFSHDRMYEQIGQLLDRSGRVTREVCERSDWMLRYDLRPVSDEDMAREIGSFFDTALDPLATWQAVSDIFWRNESIEPIVESLARHGLPMVMVSNTCSAHMRWVTGRFSVLDFFPHKILSYEVGVAKPEAAIFQAAVRAARCEPSECLFIDDMPANVHAARQLGLDAVQFTDCARLLSDLKEREIEVGEW